MRADFKIVLDACVLANYSVCDLFLKLAERPRLYLPRWSGEILGEVSRVQSNKLDWPQRLVDSFRVALTENFPEALVDDFDHLIPCLANDEKDRHVLAAAIRAGASVIVTFNTKDFPAESVDPWKVEICHPQDYLLALYSMAPEVVVQKLNLIAREKEREVEDVILHLGKSVPAFTSHLINELELDL